MLGFLLACTPDDPDDAVAVDFTTPCIPDVPAAYEALDADGEGFVIADGDQFADDPFAYTLTPENALGLDNHWQGIVRAGDHLFLSGGDFGTDTPEQDFHADVFVVTADAPTTIGRLDLDEGDEWHAGGLGQLDHVIVVPTENLRNEERTSSLRLFDVSDPLDAVELQVIERGPDTIAHAAALAHTDDGMLLASWNDKALDLYAGEDFVFDDVPFATVDDLTIDTDEVGTSGVHGQAVSLLRQCDGQLFALFNDNTSDLPVDDSTNFLDLYEFDVDGLTKIGSRELNCPPEQGCNLRAAGGAWVDPDGALSFYSAAFFRDEGGGTKAAVFR